MRNVIVKCIVVGCLMTSMPLCASDSLNIVVTGGMRGRAAGCGCKSGLLGGLPRRITAMNEHLVTKSDSTLLYPVGLDCGRLLDLNPEGGKFSSRCTLFGLGNLGLKVMGPTPRDLFYGIDFLRNTADSAGVNLVSANLIDGESDSLLFPQWKLITAESISHREVKLAITSLITYHPGQEYIAGLRMWMVEHPDSVIAGLFAAAPDADIYILTTDMSEQLLRSFLVENTSFNIVLTSSRQVYTPSPFQIESTFVANPSADGKSVDGITIQLDKQTDQLSDNYQWFSYPLNRQLTEDEATKQWLDNCLGRVLDE